MDQTDHRTRTIRAWRIVAVTTLATGLSAAAVAAPSTVTLPGKEAYPESVTSTSDGTLYVGSFASGGVARVRHGQSQAEPWIKPGAFDTRSTLGVLADERSKTIWVCSNDLSAMGVPGPSSVKGSALKGFDLATGEGKLSAELPGPHTFCNDIAVGSDGSVYVTNTAAPQILRMKPGEKQLQVWATDPAFNPPAKGGGLDGLAFGTDGNLYADTFTTAELFRVEVKDGKAGTITKLQPSRKLALTDALRPDPRGGFLMIEGSGKLDHVTFEGDRATVQTLKDGYIGPTGVTPVGNTAWVSEGQLSYLIDPAKKGQSPHLPFRLYAVDLAR